MRGRKSQAARAAERESGKVTRASLRLDAEAYRRLLVYCVMEQVTAGDVVSRLISDHLKGWALPARITARGTRTDSANSDDLDKLIDQIAA